jgi:hypothetical protein
MVCCVVLCDVFVGLPYCVLCCVVLCCVVLGVSVSVLPMSLRVFRKAQCLFRLPSRATPIAPARSHQRGVDPHRGAPALRTPHYSPLTTTTTTTTTTHRYHLLLLLQAKAAYDMEAANLAGRDPVTGESPSPHYMSLQRLRRIILNAAAANGHHHDSNNHNHHNSSDTHTSNEGTGPATCRPPPLSATTLFQARQFLYDEVGIKQLFSGDGFTVTESGDRGCVRAWRAWARTCVRGWVGAWWWREVRQCRGKSNANDDALATSPRTHAHNILLLLMPLRTSLTPSPIPCCPFGRVAEYLAQNQPLASIEGCVVRRF